MRFRETHNAGRRRWPDCPVNRRLAGAGDRHRIDAWLCPHASAERSGPPFSRGRAKVDGARSRDPSGAIGTTG